MPGPLRNSAKSLELLLEDHAVPWKHHLLVPEKSGICKKVLYRWCRSCNGWPSFTNIAHEKEKDISWEDHFRSFNTYTYLFNRIPLVFKIDLSGYMSSVALSFVLSFWLNSIDRKCSDLSGYRLIWFMTYWFSFQILINIVIEGPLGSSCWWMKESLLTALE